MNWKFYVLFTVVSISKAFGQNWHPLGCDEQAGNVVASTAAFVTYSAIDADGNPYISYTDDMAGPKNENDFKVHVKKYTGGAWVDLGAATPEFPANDFFPIACDGNQLYIAYNEPVTGGPLDGRLTVKKYNAATSAWELLGQAGFSQAESGNVGIHAIGGMVYVAYGDHAIGDKLTCKFFDTANTAAGWRQLGLPIISPGAVSESVPAPISMAYDNGYLYVAYLDLSLNPQKGGGLLVKRVGYNQVWQTVGQGVASGGEAGYLARLAAENNTGVYLAYLSPTDSKIVVRAYVPQFDQWGTYTNEPTGGDVYSGIGFAKVGEKLYLAYGRQVGGKAQARVITYDNTSNSWVAVGNDPATASQDNIINMNLRHDKDGRLNLLFHTAGNGIFAKRLEADVPMPVKLVDFTANLQEGGARLAWTISNAINLNHFEVERSADGKQFSHMGRVNARPVRDDYDFVQGNLPAGTYYFRLKMVDNDGQYSYSMVRSLVSGLQDGRLSLYPNPASKMLYLANPGSRYTYANILSADGRVLKMIRLLENNQIDISHLPTGRYFISCQNQGATKTVAFVKN